MLATQKFAMASIIKSWEVFVRTGMTMGSLKSHKEHKNALMNHLRPYMDDSFDKLEGRECFNSFVGALTQNGLVTDSLVKEIYTPDEADYLENCLGQDISDIHIQEGIDPLPGF